MWKGLFVAQNDISNLRLSTLSVERVCSVVREGLGEGGLLAAAALLENRVCGLALSVCKLEDLQPVLKLPFGDWELFKLLITNLRELEANMPTNMPAVTVNSEKTSEIEPDSSKPRMAVEHQRSRPSNVEKQVSYKYFITYIYNNIIYFRGLTLSQTIIIINIIVKRNNVNNYYNDITKTSPYSEDFRNLTFKKVVILNYLQMLTALFLLFTPLK